MSRWLLGIDAGGTRTRSLLLDLESGRTLCGEAGAANWTSLGSAACVASVRAALAHAGADGLPIAAVAAGFAGYYPPRHADEARQALGAAFGPETVLDVVPDVVVAWAGALAGEPGIVVIAGTGSIAYGRDVEGNEARAGGWGPLLGDPGSGYDVGRQALVVVAEEIDGGRKTALTGELMAAYPTLGDSPREWLRGVLAAGWKPSDVAALAPAVAQAAEHDSRARAIVVRAALSLAEMCWLVETRLQGVDRVVGAGGLWTAGTLLVKPFQEWLAECSSQLRWTLPRHAPLEGALLLAAEAAGGAKLRREVNERLSR